MNLGRPELKPIDVDGFVVLDWTGFHGGYLFGQDSIGSTAATLHEPATPVGLLASVL